MVASVEQKLARAAGANDRFVKCHHGTGEARGGYGHLARRLLLLEVKINELTALGKNVEARSTELEFDEDARHKAMRIVAVETLLAQQSKDISDIKVQLVGTIIIEQLEETTKDTVSILREAMERQGSCQLGAISKSLITTMMEQVQKMLEVGTFRLDGSAASTAPGNTDAASSCAQSFSACPPTRTCSIAREGTSAER